jgi:hypothetical protein
MKAQSTGGYLAEDTNLDGTFRRFRPFFKLRLTGTGTCVLYSKSEDGTVTEVGSFDSSAIDRFIAPYPGDDAVEIRAVYTGTCRGEMV